MLSVRNVVAGAVLFVFIALASGIFSLLGEPDSGGAAADSYGTKWFGARAAYDLLQELGAQVERRIMPPSPDVPTTATLVLWQPDPELVAVEPAYLHALIPWVERGGRLVVTPRPVQASDDMTRRLSGKASPETIFTALGLPPLFVRQYVAVPSEQVSLPGSASRRDRIRRGMEKTWRDTWSPETFGFIEVQPRGTGDLQPALLRTSQLRLLADEAYELSWASTIKPDGLLQYEDAQGVERTAAAAFRRGDGLITVVADPAWLMNVGLGSADNAVLTFDLLVGSGRSVVFDEFYHGLAVRGNPLWLLTRSRYAVGAAIAALLVGLIVWRRAVALGPPLEAAPRSRRTIVEYVEATARLFHRSRNSRPFVLDETYHGALRYLGERLNLPLGEPTPDAIAQALERRRPADAVRFRSAVAAVEAAQSRGRKVKELEALTALQGICRCL